MRFNDLLHLVAFFGKAHGRLPAPGFVTAAKMPDSRALSKFSDHFSPYIPLSESSQVAARDRRRWTRRRRVTSSRPPPQVHGPVCRAQYECLPMHGQDERTLRPPALSAGRGAACDSAHPVILLTHLPMKTLETLHRFGKCPITLLGRQFVCSEGECFCNFSLLPT